MRTPIRIATRILLMLSLLMLLIEVAYPKSGRRRTRSFENHSRIGFGYIYANPVGARFDNASEVGNGLALCWFSRDRLGYGLGSLEYIKFERPSTRESENYYQVNLSAAVYPKLVGGLHLVYGAIFFGYHNWDEAIRKEKYWYFPFFGEFLFYPLTFHSLGLGYELFFSRNVSIDLSMKYSFDLSFTRTYWQLNVSTGLFQVQL